MHFINQCSTELNKPGDQVSRDLSCFKNVEKTILQAMGQPLLKEKLADQAGAVFKTVAFKLLGAFVASCTSVLLPLLKRSFMCNEWAKVHESLTP